MSQSARYSKLGAALASIYLAWAIFCAVVAADTSDVKGNVLFLQLGILPQLDLLRVLGFAGSLGGWHWLAIYALLVPPLRRAAVRAGGLGLETHQLRG